MTETNLLDIGLKAKATTVRCAMASYQCFSTEMNFPHHYFI